MFCQPCHFILHYLLLYSNALNLNDPFFFLSIFFVFVTFHAVTHLINSNICLRKMTGDGWKCGTIFCLSRQFIWWVPIQLIRTGTGRNIFSIEISLYLYLQTHQVFFFSFLLCISRLVICWL